ncbi:MAG TPA: hypothetical protein VHY37_12755 [Tepidisphaeraceae bacterium]|nr:hypothetical protein [Tepidisphaeraceae bacterium]
MTTAELAAATKQYDRPIPASRLRPMTRAERQKFDSMRRGGVGSIFIHDRPRRDVTVKLSEDTLRRCQEYADRHHLSLSDVIDLGLATAFRLAQ